MLNRALLLQHYENGYAQHLQSFKFHSIAWLDVDIDEILFGTKNSISMETAVSQKPAKNETLTKRTSSLWHFFFIIKSIYVERETPGVKTPASSFLYL